LTIGGVTVLTSIYISGGVWDFGDAWLGVEQRQQCGLSMIPGLELCDGLEMATIGESIIPIMCIRLVDRTK